MTGDAIDGAGSLRDAWRAVGFITKLAGAAMLLVVFGAVWAVAMVLSFVWHLLWGDGEWVPTPMAWLMPEDEYNV